MKRHKVVGMLSNLGIPTIIVLIGSFTTAIAVFLAAIDPAKDIVTKGSVAFAGALIGIVGGLLGALQQSRYEMKLSSMQGKLAAYITGGESYCFISPMFSAADQDRCLFYLFREGEDPLYDLNVELIDIDQQPLDKGEAPTIEDMMKGRENLSIGNLPPSVVRTVKQVHLAGRTEYSLNISIVARNGIVYQCLRLKRLDVGWCAASKVWTWDGKEERLLMEKISSRYPLNDRGEVNW